MTRAEWYKKNGFDELGVTYIIAGDNTYYIKDMLKEAGCRFNKLLKWHSPVAVDNLPEGYINLKVPFELVYTYDKETDEVLEKCGAEITMKKMYTAAMPEVKSEFYGEAGGRVDKVTAVLDSVHGFGTQFGWTNIYTFKSGDYVFVWFTAKELDLKRNTVVELSGRIKSHEEYRGVNTTRINYCKINVIKEAE